MTLLASLLLALPAAGTTGGDITWTPSYAEGLTRAADEKRVLFVAVHMPGERGNERMARDVYTDDAILTLTERTVNLVAVAMDLWREKGTRLDLGDLTEEQLRRLDIDLRTNVLRPDENGYVIAPQHVFLKADGTVLLAVPWELTAAELEWCFVRALTLADPENPPEASSRARPPKGLLEGEAPEVEETRGPAPATLEEVEELIRKRDKGVAKDERWTALMRILTADEEVARKYATREMRSGGRNADANKAGMIRNVARLSPASWWEVVIEFNEHSSALVREEVAACLEVLEAPDAARDVQKALGKEKEPRLVGAWLRAWAASTPGDPRARKAVLKAAEKAKDAQERAGAILALGHLVPGEDVDTALAEYLTDEELADELRVAAVVAAALTRSERWSEPLAELALGEGEPAAAAALARPLLGGGSLFPLGRYVRSSTGDQVDRERLFGKVK